MNTRSLKPLWHHVPLLIGLALAVNLCAEVATTGTIPPPVPASTPLVFPGAEWDVASPESQGIDPGKLEAAMEALKAVCGADGTTKTVVIRNGHLIWKGENVTHRHIIYSCTKSFTSTCMGLLWDDGKCSPDTLACKYLPQLEKDYPQMTLGHLATFTSGYNAPRNDMLSPSAPMYPLGTAMHYSGQTDLLAAVLTRIAGEPLEDLFMRRIGNTIGLTPEHFVWGSKTSIEGIKLNYGASGIEATPLALARFGWLYANGGNWNGQQLISKKYISEACVVKVPASLPPHDPRGWYTVLPGNYGLNWWINGVNASGARKWPSAPVNTFAAQGMGNNICLIVPEWKMVIVRCGDDKIVDIGLYDRMFALLKEALEIPSRPIPQM